MSDEEGRWFPDCDECEARATAVVPGEPYGFRCDRHRGWTDISVDRINAGGWAPAVRDSAWRACVGALRGVEVPQFRVTVGESTWAALLGEGWVPDEAGTYCVRPA